MRRPQPHPERIEERVRRIEEAVRRLADGQDFWDLERRLTDHQGQQEKIAELAEDLDDRLSDVEGRIDDLENGSP